MKSGVIFSDTHCPNHDQRAVDLLCKVIKEREPDFAVANGDMFNLYSVSRHRKDPRRHHLLEDEIGMALDVWAQIDEACEGVEDKYFNFGNHETNLERYLQDKAPALVGLSGLDVTELFDLEENDWIVTPYREYITIGKVTYTHDLGATGKYAVHKAVSDAGHSIVIGHTHRMGSAYVGNINGRPRLGISFGWLGDCTAADYMHQLKARTEWVTGFGWADMDDDGNTWFQAVPIIDGTCVVGGERYSV